MALMHTTHYETFEPFTDDAGIRHAPCCVCAVDCTSHPYAAHAIAYCGDCGGVTCSEHRDESAATRCPHCAALWGHLLPADGGRS